MKKKDILKCINKYRKVNSFLLVGFLCTTIDFVIYLIVSRKISITFAKLLSTTIAGVFSLILNKNWTFQYKGKINLRLLLRYLISQIINIGINVSINTEIYKITNIKILSFIIATVIATTFNYILQKIFVFNMNDIEKR